MPVYEYLCDACGPFTDMRPMAECDESQDCPQCAGESPRVILTAPNFFCMPADRRKAHATNERSANAPKTVAEYKAKWGLPNDYPTTAPAYSEARSAMAKALGLGQGGRKAKAPRGRKG